MNTRDARTLLSSLPFPADRFVTEIGERDRVAFVKVSRVDGSADYAVIFTPGQVWFALEVSGGCGHTIFDEDATDEEVAAILNTLFGAAMAYLDGRKSTSVSRVLKLPSVLLDTETGPLELHLSLVGAVKTLLKRARQTFRRPPSER